MDNNIETSKANAEKVRIAARKAKARAAAHRAREKVNSEGEAKLLADKVEVLEKNKKIDSVPEPVKELPTKTPQNLPINFVVEESKPEPTVLSPTEQKRQSFFETLPEEEVSYYEGLSNQGLSTAQLYKIKVAKDSKTIERRA